MAEILKPVTPEVRTSHLDLLANGEKVLNEEANKNLLIAIACAALLAISGIIIYYETRSNKK